MNNKTKGQHIRRQRTLTDGRRPLVKFFDETKSTEELFDTAPHLEPSQVSRISAPGSWKGKWKQRTPFDQTRIHPYVLNFEDCTNFKLIPQTKYKKRGGARKTRSRTGNKKAKLIYRTAPEIEPEAYDQRKEAFFKDCKQLCKQVDVCMWALPCYNIEKDTISELLWAHVAFNGSG